MEVVGTGCANCKNKVALVEAVAREKGAQIEWEEVDDLTSIMGSSVMSTPGVVIDGVVVHAGGLPARNTVESWFERGGRLHSWQ